MFARILISTDGSELADKGVAEGLQLAKALGAEVTIITLSEPWTPLGVDATGAAVTEYALAAEYETAIAADCRKILEGVAAEAAAAGVAVQTIYVPRTHPSDGIVAYAETNGIDLIVMASHGRRGVRRLLLGSQAQEVLALSKVPVLIVK